LRGFNYNRDNVEIIIFVIVAIIAAIMKFILPSMLEPLFRQLSGTWFEKNINEFLIIFVFLILIIPIVLILRERKNYQKIHVLKGNFDRDSVSVMRSI
jgi:uncharacterized membrane protein YedE/YeeE